MSKSAGIISFVVLAGWAAMSGPALGGWLDDRTPSKVEPTITFAARPFALEEVRLLDSPFKHAMEKQGEYLLHLDPDRMLSGFLSESGLEPKAEPYWGWERMTIAGHSLGHWLSGLALMYASTGDERYKERAAYIVDELERCQKAVGNGYVAAIPNGLKIMEEVGAGTIRSRGFDLNGLWVPWYTLHKQLAGLLDVQRYMGNEKALEVAKGLGDWSVDITAELNEEQFQLMLACEFGGMNEVLAELYARTGDEKYLRLARRFYHNAVLDPLARGEDNLPGKHANTQFPKIIGQARLYALEGKAEDREISDFFWNTVVNHHTYVTGGNSNHEYFGPPDQLNDRLSANTAESCNVYNMLKLTRHLFAWSADARLADYYERALYNHILGSINPDDGMTTYFIPLQSGERKTYSNFYHSFSCCHGSGMENHAKYGDSIYFQDDAGLIVNLFIPSVLTWKDRGLTVRQETGYPFEATTRLALECAEPVEMTLRIRHPYWAVEGLKVQVNGSDVEADSEPQSYLALRREWKSGDRIEVTFPMGPRVWPMPDNPNRAAVLWGGMALAGDLGPGDGEPIAPWDIPVLVTGGKPVSEWLTPVDLAKLQFRTVGVGKPEDVTLIPFFQTHHRRYVVYWDFFNEEEVAGREAERQAELRRQQELADRTIDHLRIGEMQPERDHNLTGERTSAGDLGARKWRHATNGGWFSFEMAVDPARPMALMCQYWGGDGGGREFDILIDGEVIATQVLNNNQPGEFFDVLYPIPEALVAGKEKVTVRFQAKPDRTAGGVFDCRMMAQTEPPA